MKKYLTKELFISCLIGIAILVSISLYGCGVHTYLGKGIEEEIKEVAEEHKEAPNPYYVDEKYKNVDVDKIANFEPIGKSIYVDTTTGVLYKREVLYSMAYMSVILNADGTPKNIKDYIMEDK